MLVIHSQKVSQVTMVQGCLCRRMGDVCEWVEEAAALREALLRRTSVSRCAFLNDFPERSQRTLKDRVRRGVVWNQTLD